ncbi:MAG TPA: hypothetical protein VE974_06175 [Thermoanaerobaculia bacterium]|nr:hypothetical protein [Thermoanaerobaculia bacterium]
MSLFTSDPKEEPQQVKCDECKHYIDVTDAQIVAVETEGYMYFTYSWLDRRGFAKAYYCPMHRRTYDRIDQDGTMYKLIPAVPEHYDKLKAPELDLTPLKRRKAKTKK